MVHFYDVTRILIDEHHKRKRPVKVMLMNAQKKRLRAWMLEQNKKNTFKMKAAKNVKKVMKTSIFRKAKNHFKLRR